MNSYNDETLTLDDISEDEQGSTFTGCTFEGDPITNVNFSFAAFNECTFNTVFKNCNLYGIDGDTLPNLAVVLFGFAPDNGHLIKDNLNKNVGRGDGNTTEFEYQRINVDDISIAIGRVPVESNTYEATAGIVDRCAVGGWNSGARDEWLSECVLEVTTDAEDTYQPYDNIPDIPADGTSTCSIIVKKKDRNGNYKTDETDNDQIDIRCTRGSLDALRTNLVNGEATITLTSVSETCISTIEVWGSGEGSTLRKKTIEIQFAPVS